MFPRVESFLRAPMRTVWTIPLGAFSAAEPAMAALEAEVARLAGQLQLDVSPVGMEFLLARIDVAYDAPPLALEFGGAMAGRKIAVLRLQYRLLQSMACAAEWLSTLQLCLALPQFFTNWLGIRPALRFRQIGGNCAANVLQYCLLRSQHYRTSEVLGSLRKPSCVALVQAAQQAYWDGGKPQAPCWEPEIAGTPYAAAPGTLQAALHFNLCYLEILNEREGEAGSAPGVEHFRMRLNRPLNVNLTFGGFCNMSDVRPVPPGESQRPLHIRDRKERRQLRRERLSPAEKSWLHELENDLRAEGLQHDYLLVAFDQYPKVTGHLIVVDLFSPEPGLFDPNYGFVDLPAGEWFGDQLLWLICLLAMQYKASKLWFGHMDYLDKKQARTIWHPAPRRAPRMRLVRRPPRK